MYKILDLVTDVGLVEKYLRFIHGGLVDSERKDIHDEIMKRLKFKDGIEEKTIRVNHILHNIGLYSSYFDTVHTDLDNSGYRKLSTAVWNKLKSVKRWYHSEDCDAIRYKEKGVLTYSIYREDLNRLFRCLKSKEYDVFPRDAYIHRCYSPKNPHGCIHVMISSKEFELTGFDDKIVPFGSMIIDEIKKIITFGDNNDRSV